MKDPVDLKVFLDTVLVAESTSSHASEIQTYGMLWSTVARVQSGLRTRRPALRLGNHKSRAKEKRRMLQSLECLGSCYFMNEVTLTL